MSKRKSESASFHARRRAAPPYARARAAFARTGLLVAVAGFSCACAPVTTLDGERLAVRSEAFAAYVEEVFREQNRVATELAFALEDSGDPARIEALETAEAALLAACAELNALATARRDGERSGPIRGLAAARRAPECERASADAVLLLEQEDGAPGA